MENNLIKTNKSSKDNYSILIYFLTALILITNGKTNTVLSLIILIGFVPFIINPEKLIAPVLLTTFYESYLIVIKGVTFSRVLVIYFIIGVFLNCIKEIRITKEKSSDIKKLLIFVAMAIVFSLFSSYGYVGFPSTVIFNIALAICFVILDIKDIDDLCEQFFIFSAIAIIFGLYVLITSGTLNTIDSQRLNLGEDVNANTIAQSFSVMIVIVYIHFAINYFKNRIIHIGLLIASFVLLFLSGSRTSLIAAILTILISSILMFFDNTKQLKKVILYVVIATIIVVTIYIILERRYPTLMNRFTVKNVQDSEGSGRADVWRAFFKYIFPKHWLFGIGQMNLNMYYAVLPYNGEGHTSHNFIVELLSAYGVFGFTIYLIVLTEWIRKGLKCLKINIKMFYVFTMFINVLLLGIGEELTRGRMLWLSIGLLLSFCNCIEKSKERNNDDKMEVKIKNSSVI